jgi:hypothetical protein
MKYKLRLAEPGDYLYSEDGIVYVGEAAADALDFYIDEALDDEDEVWVHPEILCGLRDSCRLRRPGHRPFGDTTYDLIAHSPERALRPLKPGEIRTWPRGTWRPGWLVKPPWCSSGDGYEVAVGGETIGNSYPDSDAARAALRAKEAELIEAWKAAHPEYRRDAPVESDPDEVMIYLRARSDCDCPECADYWHELAERNEPSG